MNHITYLQCESYNFFIISQLVDCRNHHKRVGGAASSFTRMILMVRGNMAGLINSWIMVSNNATATTNNNNNNWLTLILK